LAVLETRPTPRSQTSNYLDHLIATRRFEWDETKNKSNRSKHGIWFAEAQAVFDDPQGRVFVDPEHSDQEERFITIGMSSAAMLLVAVHCDRQSRSAIRIISARAAAKREVRFYGQAI
jgi:uncharacterized protein